MSTRTGNPAETCDALVMIRTPLQLLNAVEARRHFNFASTALMIVEFSGHGLPPFDLSLVDPEDWTTILTVDLNPVSGPFPRSLLNHPRLASSEKINVLRQIYRRRSYDQALDPWCSVSNLLLGNYLQGWFLHAAQRCPQARCILLDDGTDTLRIAANRHQPGPKAEHSPVWRRPKAWLYQRYASWDTRQRDRLTFFTSYRLDLPPGDQLVLNTYPHTRSRIQAIEQDHRCLFLGQPLVEDGYLTSAEFARLLSAVKNSLGGGEIFYVPHRREQRAQLDQVLSELGIRQLPIDKAFEYYLLESPTVPKMVSSFFSSALDTCRLIWGDLLRIVAFRLPPASLLLAHDYVGDVYRYFTYSSNGSIEVLDPGQPIPPERP